MLEVQKGRSFRKRGRSLEFNRHLSSSPHHLRRQLFNSMAVQIGAQWRGSGAYSIFKSCCELIFLGTKLQMLELPCGCQWRRYCAHWIFIGWFDSDEVRCKSCDSLIFNSVAWRWLDKHATVTRVEALEEELKACVICHEVCISMAWSYLLPSSHARRVEDIAAPDSKQLNPHSPNYSYHSRPYPRSMLTNFRFNRTTLPSSPLP